MPAGARGRCPGAGGIENHLNKKLRYCSTKNHYEVMIYLDNAIICFISVGDTALPVTINYFTPE